MATMAIHWKDNVGGLIALVLALILFNTVIQPVLVGIDPMFSDQYVPPNEAGGLVPGTPAQWATLVTMIVLIFAYAAFRLWMDVYFSDPTE